MSNQITEQQPVVGGEVNPNSLDAPQRVELVPNGWDTRYVEQQEYVPLSTEADLWAGEAREPDQPPAQQVFEGGVDEVVLEPMTVDTPGGKATERKRGWLFRVVEFLKINPSKSEVCLGLWQQRQEKRLGD